MCLVQLRPCQAVCASNVVLFIFLCFEFVVSGCNGTRDGTYPLRCSSYPQLTLALALLLLSVPINSTHFEKQLYVHTSLRAWQEI